MRVILVISFLTIVCYAMGIEAVVDARDFYVSVETGLDSSDGSSATEGSGSVGPWATIAHAVDTIGALKNRNYNVNTRIRPALKT